MIRNFRPTLLAVSILITTPALAQQPPLPPSLNSLPSISVSGEAQVSVPPDLARVEAGVVNVAKTARGASDANNLAMGKVLLQLKTAGIDGKDVQTSQLSLQPQYSSKSVSSSTEPGEIVSFRASNIVTVKVHDVANVSNIVDALVSAGANEIRGISFSVSDASNRLDEARGQAIADARRKAELYARAAGVTLGAPLSISEDYHQNPMPLRRMASEFATRAQISPGEETLGVSVIVNWAIKAP